MVVSSVVLGMRPVDLQWQGEKSKGKAVHFVVDSSYGVFEDQCNSREEACLGSRRELCQQKAAREAVWFAHETQGQQDPRHPTRAPRKGESRANRALLGWVRDRC